MGLLKDTRLPYTEKWVRPNSVVPGKVMKIRDEYLNSWGVVLSVTTGPLSDLIDGGVDLLRRVSEVAEYVGEKVSPGFDEYVTFEVFVMPTQHGTSVAPSTPRKVVLRVAEWELVAIQD